MRFVVAPDFDFGTVASSMPGGRADLLRDHPGVVGLYVMQDDIQVGAMVIGETVDGRGRDLVLYALSGGAPGLIDSVDAFMRSAAMQGGYDGVRAFTARPGMMRHFHRHGWGELGRVYRAEVSHG